MPHPMRTRYLLGFGLATGIMVLVGASIMLATQRFRADTQWVSHSQEVIGRLAQIRATLLDGISTQRSYLLTGNQAYRDQYQAVRPEIRAEVARLASLLADNPAQSQRASRLGDLIDKRLDSASEAVRVYDDAGLVDAQRYLGRNRGYELMLGIQQLMAQMQDDEQRLLAQRSRDSARSANILMVLGALGIPLSLLIMWAIYAQLSREVREREAAQAKAEDLNQDLGRSVSGLERATSDLREIGHYAGLLQGCRHVPEALEVTRVALGRLLPDVAGTVYLLRASQDYAEAEICWGEHLAPAHALLLPQECWALRRVQPHFVHDVHGGNACSHLDQPAAGVAVATACLPLSAQNLSLGFIYLSAPGPGPIARMEIASAAAEQLSLALGNLRLQETLRQQSIRDALTGLYNRRYLEESLPRELSRCERRKLPLALLMLDLDHFKAFNDAHGHDGGDALLAGFGRLLLASCRGEDIPCRYGGEEFILILPEADLRTATHRAEEIRTALEAMTVPHLQRTIGGSTVSIGIALFPQHAGTGDELKRMADAALYRAKRNGRNRVEVAGAA
ncbi:GGDEF domain-containing protein [Luteimonas sp. 50]|uniref:diguanylate cyclase n=1 Tax=Cognatiluteimonas sedimenti TaxID=2927791 RepID=A0ABT0A1V8_9GAMM|nr:GGDEF domain-containing protein [Lysobacter sedimenti]MCJ0824946.1 GGDEF domain-containing protein [Lysobacter sedimenti]